MTLSFNLNFETLKLVWRFRLFRKVILILLCLNIFPMKNQSDRILYIKILFWFHWWKYDLKKKTYQIRKIASTIHLLLQPLPSKISSFFKRSILYKFFKSLNKDMSINQQKLVLQLQKSILTTYGKK